jgi:phage protein D
MIDGNPNAKAGGRIVISGARAGVDGTYTISEAEHHYSRASGYVTRCNLADPQAGGGAGGGAFGEGWNPGAPGG